MDPHVASCEASQVAQWQRIHQPVQAHRRHGFSSWVRETPWRRHWQPTPVFLPGNSSGQRSLAGCRLCGREELDAAERPRTRSLPQELLAGKEGLSSCVARVVRGVQAALTFSHSTVRCSAADRNRLGWVSLVRSPATLRH